MRGMQNQAEKVRINRARRAAARQGLLLERCPSRTPGTRGYGGFLIVDRRDRIVHGTRYNLTIADVEAWLVARATQPQQASA